MCLSVSVDVRNYLEGLHHDVHIVHASIELVKLIDALLIFPEERNGSLRMCICVLCE